MYKEYRELSRTDAVETLYQDMAARHRSRFRSIHVSTPPRHNDALDWLLTGISTNRFSRSLRLRRPPISAAPTSSSSSPRTSSSPCPTASTRPLASSSLPSDHPPSKCPIRQWGGTCGDDISGSYSGLRGSVVCLQQIKAWISGESRKMGIGFMCTVISVFLSVWKVFLLNTVITIQLSPNKLHISLPRSI